MHIVKSCRVSAVKGGGFRWEANGFNMGSPLETLLGKRGLGREDSGRARILDLHD